MCTIVWLQRGDRRVFLANRDERLDRPASPPTLHAAGSRQVLAPTDLQAGGTWFGVNDRGLVAAVTNRFGSPPRPDLPSRGELVFRALRGDSAAAAAAGMDVDPRGYNGFHLVLSDPAECLVLWNDTVTLHRASPGPGVHVVTERSFMEPPSPREAWLAQRLDGVEPGPDWIPLMTEGRLDAPFDGPFVHLPERGYGTRSTTYVEFGREMTYLHREWLPKPSAVRDDSKGFDAAS